MEKKRRPLQFECCLPGLSCWTFLSQAGSSVVSFELIVDTRVSIPSFGGFSLLLSALAGVHKLVILAGEFPNLTNVILMEKIPYLHVEPFLVIIDLK